jgi:hypothetical protein
MSKDPDSDLEMRDEYDFSDGVRNKYAARFREGSNVVVLDPDVAAEFPTQEAVNKALRVLLIRPCSGLRPAGAWRRLAAGACGILHANSAAHS